MARSKDTRFTDMMIRKLKPDEKKYLRSEGNGFTIRVLTSGGKRWLYIYSLNGKRREMPLGNYPEMSLEEARVRFGEAMKKVKSGKDPMAEQEAEAEARRTAPTLKDLCEEYIERHAKRFKKAWEEDQRILTRDVIPAWGGRKAAAILKRDVINLLEGIIDRGSPGMANNTFQVIRKMFNFAVERDILPFSPCNGLKLPAPKQSRDRVLSEREITAFWHNLDACAISSGVKTALKLVLVTAQRPGEVIGLHTSEIGDGWWSIPAERAKNGKAHRVPLTPLATELIEQAAAEVKTALEIPPDQEYSGFIFPVPRRNKDRAMDGHALSIAIARNLAWPVTDPEGKPLFNAQGEPATENRIGVEKFTPHDLRRTAATRMAESGEMDEVIDAILNHAKQGVIKVYNQYRYDKEKRAALESWSRKLQSIITGSTAGKVISIRAGHIKD
jgi:integrase